MTGHEPYKRHVYTFNLNRVFTQLNYIALILHDFYQ